MNVDTLSCRLCGGSVGRVAHRIFEKQGHVVVRCPHCSLVYRADLPTRDALRGIYDEQYFKAATDDRAGTGYRDYLAEESTHRIQARRRLDLLSSFIDLGRIYDVGCAAGFFLDEARKQGWSVKGVDISEQMAERARKQLSLDVAGGLFVEQPVETCDALTMWDYIEHVVDPAEELEHAAACLRPGGVLALSTGDVESVAARVSGSCWHLFTPRHHNFFFSRETLASYLARAGFATVYVGHPGGSYSLAYLLHKLKTMTSAGTAHRAAAAAAGTRLARVRVPVNLFDIMTVIALRR